MLKDIYSLGICILEMMIGRTSQRKFSISLDSLPLTWSEYNDSTPLIQVLVECIQIDSITQRKGKLQHIRKLLIREYKKFFNKEYYKMENPFMGKRADVLNKRGIVSLFHGGKEGDALHYWAEAQKLKDRHYDSRWNYCMHRWSSGVISDDELKQELAGYVFAAKDKGEVAKACMLVALGERSEGRKLLNEYLEQTEKTTSNLREIN